MIMWRFIFDTIRGNILECNSAKRFLDAIGQKFVEYDKTEFF